jgi:hypothetical protein
MLGTNDFQSMHPHSAWLSAQGMAALVDAVRRAPIEPGMPVPKVLIVAPPAIGDLEGALHRSSSTPARKAWGSRLGWRSASSARHGPGDHGSSVAYRRLKRTSVVDTDVIER